MGRHTRFLNLAAAEAESSDLETKHGSLLVRGGKVLGSGHNSSRSRLQGVPGDANVISLHSEVRRTATTRHEDVLTFWTPAPSGCWQVAEAKAVPCLLQGSAGSS